MTFVAESLIAESDANCPDCGTTVVVDQARPPSESIDALSAAETAFEKRKVTIDELPLSVRCRLQITKMNIDTVGELLQIPKNVVRQHFAESPDYFEQIQTMLDEHGLKWHA